MKKLSLAAAAIPALFTGTASAADMAVKARCAPIPVAVFTSGTILEAGTQATIARTRASVPAAKVADATRASSTQ